MNLLVFRRDDDLITKALRRFHNLVCISANPAAPCELTYDPESDDYKVIQRRLQGFIPDAILLFNLDYGQFVQGLDESGVPVIAPISDSNLCFDAFRNSLPFVDLVICNEEAQQSQFKRYGFKTAYLPWFCVDPEVFYPRHEKPVSDVIFCGNLNPYVHRQRGRILEKLLSCRLFETRVVTGVRGQAYAAKLAQGRIVFNYTIRGEVNQRVYETLGVGRLLLIED